jgi:hypothetical protein
MIMVTKSDILERLPDLLAELAGLPVKSVRQGENADLLLRLGPHLLAVEARTNSRAGLVAQAAENARQATGKGRAAAIPLVAVPFMGEVGRTICREHGVNYVDLSGNADINAPGLRIHVAGKPNLFVQRGRPSSVFAPKSCRLARILLAEPKRWWRQAELASAGQLGAGYVSRICRRLEEDHLIERDSEGSVRPRDPNLLLEAWQAQYDLRRHDIRQGHVAARSGEELARQVAEACQGLGFDYALTGMAAAWLLAPFAGYRLVTIYLRKSANDKLLQRLKWHEEKRGANLWLIRPNDEGVFHGAQNVKSMVCVSPVQAYLDLRNLPERAEEAAEHLRKERLKWQ